MLKPVTAAWRAPLALGFVWLAASACSATESRTPEPVDCSSADAYELKSLMTFEAGEEMTWFPSGDPTGQVAPSPQGTDTSACAAGGTGGAAAGAAGGGTGGIPTRDTVTTTVAYEPIDGGRCGSAQALAMRSTGHTDWGSVFGNWKVSQSNWDGAGYEGFMFWARSVGDHSVTLALDTWQTSSEGAAAAGAQPGEVCLLDCNAGSGTQAIDDNGNILSQSYVSPPGTCGNSFQYTLTTTEKWQLYKVPFKSFFQELKPNLVAGGVNPAHINGFAFRIPKEAGIELWVDDVALYRKK